MGLYELWEHLPASELALHFLNLAVDARIDNEPMNVFKTPEPPLTWPSTLPLADDLMGGGLYGLTTLMGEKGAGKSTLMLGSLLEAAATRKWQVVHFVAEDDLDGFNDRFNKYLQHHAHIDNCFGQDDLEDSYHAISVGTNCSPQQMTDNICAAIDCYADIPILVGIDSIQSTVNLSEQEFYPGLHRLSMWAMLARRMSRGKVSFCISSETNYKGSSKGVNLGFLSDVVLRIKSESEFVVSIEIDKSRRTAGAGSQWKLERFIPGASFVGINESVQLHAV